MFWLPTVFFWLPAGCFLLPTGCCPVLSAQTQPPEHKIVVFVLFWPSEPSFSGFSSTKSAFLCSGSMCWGLLGSCYSGRAAQRVLLLLGECCSGCGAVYLLAARRAKSSFLNVAAFLKSSAYMPAAMAPSTLAGLSSVKRHSEALSPNFWQSRS